MTAPTRQRQPKRLSPEQVEQRQGGNALSHRWALLRERAELIDLGRELVQLQHQGRRTWGAL